MLLKVLVGSVTSDRLLYIFGALMFLPVCQTVLVCVRVWYANVFGALSLFEFGVEIVFGMRLVWEALAWPKNYTILTGSDLETSPPSIYCPLSNKTYPHPAP